MTTEVIEDAMKTTPVKKVISWYKNNIGQSVQRKKLSRVMLDDSPEVKLDQLYTEV